MHPTGSLHVQSFPMAGPHDFGSLADGLARGAITAARIVALWVKTEGNGLANDFTRESADRQLKQLLAPLLGLEPEAVGEAVQIIVSGGSEGVVAPHMVVVTREPDARGLRGALVRQPIGAADIGAPAHVAQTAAMVLAAAGEAGLAPAEVEAVLVKTPTRSLAFAQLVAARVAAAAGVGVALEGPEHLHTRAAADGSSKAFVVARPGDVSQQVLVLGNPADGAACIASGPLASPLDLAGATRLLARLGQPAPERIRAVLVKGDAPRGPLHGWRHTMHDDPTLPMHRQARAVYGALAAAATGHPACLVSGGAERHGPAEGGCLTLICAPL